MTEHARATRRATPTRWQGVVDDSSPVEIEWITPLAVVFESPTELPGGRHRLRLADSAVEFAFSCDSVHAGTPVRAHLEPPSQRDAEELIARVLDAATPQSLGFAPTAPTCAESIVDEDRIAELFAMFRKHEAPAIVRAAGDPSLSITGRWHRDGLLLSAEQLATLHGPVDCEVDGRLALFRYRAADVPSVALPPPRLERIRHRRHRRFRAPAGVTVRARHPVWPVIEVSGELLEIGFGGLSVECDVERQLLFAGLELDLELAWRGHAHRCRAVVCHVSQGASGYRCGLEVLEPQRGWWNLVASVAYRTTALGIADPETLWEIYTSSGYFSLSGKRPEEFATERAAFDDASRRLAVAPSLGGCFVFRTVDRIHAAISQLQVWPGAWLVFQLGRTEERPFNMVGVDVLGDLYAHAYEHVARQDQSQWLVNYVQDVATWSRRVHLDVPARFIEAGRASITPFRAIEVPTQLTESKHPFEIGPASRDELEDLRLHVAANRPTPYVSAMAMDTVELPEAFVEQWRRAGLTRSREVLVARLRGKPIAAIVLESMTRGLHLFRLTDSCRVWWLDRLGPKATLPLLAAAAAWFQRLGLSHFVLFWEHESPPPAGRDLGGASVSVLDAGAIPEVVEDVYADTARIRARGTINRGARR